MDFLTKVVESSHPKFHLVLVKMVFEFMYNKDDEVYFYDELRKIFSVILSNANGKNCGKFCAKFCSCGDTEQKFDFTVIGVTDKCLVCDAYEIYVNRAGCNNIHHQPNLRLKKILDITCTCGDNWDPDYKCVSCDIHICKECYDDLKVSDRPLNVVPGPIEFYTFKEVLIAHAMIMENAIPIHCNIEIFEKKNCNCGDQSKLMEHERYQPLEGINIIDLKGRCLSCEILNDWSKILTKGIDEVCYEHFPYNDKLDKLVKASCICPDHYTADCYDYCDCGIWYRNQPGDYDGYFEGCGNGCATNCIACVFLKESGGCYGLLCGKCCHNEKI